MQLVFPADRAGVVSDADLERLYAFPGDRVWVRANFVTTVDGAAQGGDRRSGTLSSATDKRLFAFLRSLSDVILVGANTTRVEGYRPVIRSEVDADLRARNGLAATPVLAVVSHSLDLRPGLLEAAHAPTIVITTESAPPERRRAIGTDHPVIVAGRAQVDLRTAVDELAASGHRRILCEGGPRILHGLLSANRLDELCLTVSPQLVAGDRLPITGGPAFEPAHRLRLRHLLEHDGELFARYAAEPTADAPTAMS